jgi:dynein heavy chain
MLDNWLKCQGTWLYLEPIFSSPDIVKQMPEEGQKFAAVDADWREIMGSTHRAPEAISIARDAKRLERLQECNLLLEQIQKGLAAYLEKKRLFFPRFFFLSNDEMLEILSETKDPLKVQPHLKKCFEGINTLTFTDAFDITHMNSIEKEEVPFVSVISTAKANGAVEKWLLQTEEAMFEGVKAQTSQGLAAFAGMAREQWVLEWPGMVVLLVTCIAWTTGVQGAIEKSAAEPGAVKAYEQLCTAQLMSIVELVRAAEGPFARGSSGRGLVVHV